ncbi:hypothetical protein V8G54_004322 [Vigna mungo]|uniref:Uncharacterized protein n=1 Tax=Vigna mungo TaxID=3915 RepID=A0AAQ3PFZ8_VIGMU
MWPLILPNLNDVIYTSMHAAYGGRQRCFEASPCFFSVLVNTVLKNNCMAFCIHQNLTRQYYLKIKRDGNAEKAEFASDLNNGMKVDFALRHVLQQMGHLGRRKPTKLKITVHVR